MNLIRSLMLKTDLLRLNSLGKFSSLCSQRLTDLVVSKPSVALRNCQESAQKTTVAIWPSYNLTQVREYKSKTRLRKRCKSCYFVWRNGRLYVECEENPRHKQHHMKSILKGYESIPFGYDIRAEKAEKEAAAAWRASVL